MGIGINTGEVVVGNIGSEQRSKYGAVGSAINTCYRIESYTVGGQILISPETYQKFESNVLVHGTMEVEFKGVKGPVTLYDVAGVKGENHLIPREEAADPLVELTPALPVMCFPMEGKTVSQSSLAGRMTRLGKARAEILLQGELKAHDNLKMVMKPDLSSQIFEIYAKVLSVDSSDSQPPEAKALIAFTWVSEEVRIFLDKLNP